MPVIHVHIPAGLADDQVIHIHLQGDDEPVQVQPAQLAQDDTIEGMLRRLEASPSASPHPPDTLAALQEMGYELRLAKMGNSTGQREKYIRFMDPHRLRTGWLHAPGIPDLHQGVRPGGNG